MNETKLEMFDDVGGFVEGEMSIPSTSKSTKPGEPDFNTLDEPIRETILRDVKTVAVKFTYVLFPKEKKRYLKNVSVL
ncbi:hypothetical protein MML48_4g00009594 [Holotrichia oblita]|uniref:Uncharacterized protein n=1 Tax=Holotrichia oblita TaxID=644536 RepID=A0ACB9T9Y1_HOLOL|nr:hypothetical protein MML48_4g00009594 [Holotrichia oblita]